jgi:arsenate reductase
MTSGRPVNVLFLCTGNSARSILAEATFNRLAPPSWRARSAGSHPTGYVHPRALALLARQGIPTAGLHSKAWDDVQVAPDIVITVCASAAGEACPAYLGSAVRGHWGVDDPARAEGSDAEIDASFMRAYRILRARIEAFLALPLDDLIRDRGGIAAEVERIAVQVPTASAAASVAGAR